FLSEDGGLTFPHLLASNVPNDGNETVQIPNINTTQGRIKVKASNNIFFDISDQSITINQNVSEPIVANPAFNSVTQNEAILGAELISDGGSTVTERGIVWSVQNNPVIGNTGVTKIAEGGIALGTFQVNAVGLPPGTTLYFRGYATNSKGTGYTQTKSFATDDGRVRVRFTTLDLIAPESEATGTDCEKVYDIDLNIEISEPPLTAVYVNVQGGGDALPGIDYNILTPNPILFSAGLSSTKKVTIRIYDDAEKEIEEKLELSLSVADTTTAAPGPKAIIRITDNDREPESNTEISEEIGRSSMANLSPNGKVHFFDETTGKLMATIENLGGYDFGCTWVEIDREGAGTLPFWEITPDNKKDLLEKTFFIHTENNQPTNDYEVTLYYSQAEVNGWLNNTGGTLSWDSMQIALSPGQMNNINPNQPEPDGPVHIYSAINPGPIGKGYAVKAVFTHQPGGFGVGQIGTQDNLVKFIKLDGYYNPEEKVNLEWTTKGESKVVHFDLIRIDQNGKTEELMVQVPAVGNSFQEETYQYRDEFDVDLFVKYIIKANFEDETFALSDTFQIEPEELISNLYPNP
ncbi:MAG: hypothetical protein KDD99_30430, partial [Bacteroidetes bacterium]|nr:hypothetical protein [Bacteroidota bacterium]